MPGILSLSCGCFDGSSTEPGFNFWKSFSMKRWQYQRYVIAKTHYSQKKKRDDIMTAPNPKMGTCF